MTKQQENRAFAKMIKEFPKVFGRVSFRERLMLRAAFTYVIEEVTDDLKANADLAIEGRDIKIKELELELKVEKDLLQEETKLHLHAEEYNKSLEEENNKLLDVINNQDVKIAELEQLIDEMKCCCNCDWSNYLPNGNCLDCDGKKNWKLKEIEK